MFRSLCKNWDTRVAAAHAIGAIAENVKHTSLTELFGFVESEMSVAGISGIIEDVVKAWPNVHPKVVAGLSFRSVDLNKVLGFGALLATGGQFMDVNDMFRDEDLLVQNYDSHENGMGHRFYYTSQSGNRVQQLVSNVAPSFSKRPSARERNLLKRKAKINAKDQAKVWSEDGDAEAAHSQNPVTPNITCTDRSSSNKVPIEDVLDDGSVECDGDGRWPFQNFIEQLILDLFDPNWEIRHGSMMALREILTQQGGSAGVFMPDPTLENFDIKEIEDTSSAKMLKREREIDMNVEVAAEPEPDMKRPKSEGVLCQSICASVSTGMEDNVGGCIKTENDGWSSVLAFNGGISTETVKVEHVDSQFHCMEASGMEQSSHDDKSLVPDVDILSNLSEKCKLVKLVKLTRYSWIKNWEVLQDCAIRFLCVLSLDRGCAQIHVSDQVVAPVRETCAQALGAVLKYMHPSLVHETLNILLQMQRRPEWEIRHGSLLGIKYLVAVRREMLQDLLGYVLPACRAEIYSQEEMIPQMKEKQAFDLNEVVQVDDHGEGIKFEENPYMLSTLAPRLWPFMRHNITSVRYSAIRTLERLLEAGCRRNSSEAVDHSCWPSFILGDTLRIVFQNLLLESNEDILKCSERVWRLLLQVLLDTYMYFLRAFLFQISHSWFTLRRYQQEGINWLAFLRRFKLHGILCDDMGLGKTLQASAIVASDIAERRASQSVQDPLSLIICPSTLVGHWAYEIEKFIDPTIIKTLQYAGSIQERSSLRSLFEKHNVIITSYDVVHKDIDHLEQVLWNYCILDEGHIIKNSKSKITGAVKQLKAEHRLILSGTPIQNNVLELWSLFDFLMPGFLGTERQFQASYGKPLLAAKDAKCSAKDAEAGVLAMEALHKQVMPFLLRRTKDQVLSDLPAKIILDRYCDLSPVHLELYKQFSGSDVRKNISSLVKVNGSTEVAEEHSPSPKASSHVFQALQYLLKLCSHPLLVLGERLPESVLSLLSKLIPGSSDVIRIFMNYTTLPN
ncbi:hypothetical protein C5167_019290 [Papaver somniferum]|uniref:Helicase ATP-binding domain-containing protein n=1 Tax=Papaver somniferum TaxID=3469 RepID=A0A4Y7ITQ6_PAPSO|nr:hypothetical protein C5167_019290 [Papaver somniferum]